jgi:hypothetical protein
MNDARIQARPGNGAVVIDREETMADDRLKGLEGGTPGIPPLLAGVLAIVVLLICASNILGGHAVGAVEFRSVDWANFTQVLLPFVVIALLIERTVQVFLGLTIEPRVQEERGRAEQLRLALNEANAAVARGQDTRSPHAAALVEKFRVANADPPAPGAVQLADRSAAEVARVAATHLAESDRRLRETTARKMWAAFLMSISLGILAGTTGLRVLSSVLVDLDKSWLPVVAARDSAAAAKPQPAGQGATTSTTTTPPTSTTPTTPATTTTTTTTPPQPSTAPTSPTTPSQPGTATSNTPSQPGTTTATPSQPGTTTTTTGTSTTTGQGSAAPADTGKGADQGKTGGTSANAATTPPAGRVPRWFILLDVLLTAGLLSGGADGINHITELIATYLGRLNKQADPRSNPTTTTPT